MTREDIAACAGIPAPRPTPPDFGPDDAYLDRIIEPLRAEIHARVPEFNSLSTDGIEHIIVIGARHPTKAMCDDLHARFGPWIRVEQREGVELLSIADGD
jgi:hypothetical protein